MIQSRALFLALFTATLATLALPATALQRPIILTGQASVIDGDTLEIQGQRVRLHGIDAPESGQLCLDARNRKYRCGQKAALALSGRIGRGHVACEITGKDRYGRLIGVCANRGTNLNGWMVREGWAVAYRKFSRDYAKDEDHARTREVGLWQGHFVTPEQWRKGARLQTRTASTTNSCSIKGNINAKGHRIYHPPDSPWYAKTRINQAAGERWFCSEAEARAAGWRRARQ